MAEGEVIKVLKTPGRLADSADIVFDLSDKEPEVIIRGYGFRGYERILRGASPENIALIASRICGMCSHSHQIAAASAVESALGLDVPEAARRIRKAMLLAEMLDNHVTSMLFFSFPDLLMPTSSPSARSIVNIYKMEEEIVKRIYALKSFASTTMKAVGGRAVHPVSVAVGGVSRPLYDDTRSALLGKASTFLNLVSEIAKMAKVMLKRNSQLLESFGSQECMLAAVKSYNEVLDPLGQDICVLGSDDGKWEGSVSGYREKLQTHLVEGSMIRRETISDTTCMVGPLARININRDAYSRVGIPELDDFLADGAVDRSAFHRFTARIVEIACCWKELVELFSDDIISDDEVLRQAEIREATGVAGVESSEGILLYDVEITDEGKLERVRIITPSNMNMELLEEAICEMVMKDGFKPEDDSWNNKLGLMFRVFNPHFHDAVF